MLLLQSRGPPPRPARSAPSARPPRAARARRWPPSRGPGAPKPPRTPPPSGARARPAAPTHPSDSHPRRRARGPCPSRRGSRSTRGTRRARHRPPRRRPRSPRRPSRAPRRRVPRTPRGHAPGAHPRKRPRGGAARSCRRPRRRRRSLRGVRGAWWRVSDARARVDAREPCVKGNGRDASPSRRFDGSRAPSTERPIRHSVVAEKSTRAAPSGETTTSDATAVGSARARETYRQARSRPPPSRPRSLRRRTPRGAVTRRPRRRELSSETLAV